MLKLPPRARGKIRLRSAFHCCTNSNPSSRTTVRFTSSQSTAARFAPSSANPHNLDEPPSPRRRSDNDKTGQSWVGVYNQLRNVRYEERARSWSGTITATKPGLVTQDDLLGHLPDGDIDFSVTTVVVLFTPELARFHTEAFVKKILTRLCRAYLQKPSLQSLIRVVTGVVDKVPASRDDFKPQSPVSEGISILLTNAYMDQATHLSPDNRRKPAILRFGSAMGHIKYPYPPPPAQQPLSPQWSKQTQTKAQFWGTHELHLPVSNTLFVNGWHSTLAESFWKREKEGRSPAAPAPAPAESESESQSQSQSQSLQLARGFRYLKEFLIYTGVPSDVIFGAISPLRPLTTPRVIHTAMGNIIREIKVDGQVVTAASELEIAVPKYLESGHDDTTFIDGKPLVYAVVHDPANTPGSNLDSLLSPLTKTDIKDLLDTGARVLRVTGGGGGWGAKKGLLSLEPSTGLGDYDSNSNKDSDDINNKNYAKADGGQQQEQEQEQEQEDALQPPNLMGKAVDLVQPGQIVQFFICAAQSYARPVEESGDGDDGDTLHTGAFKGRARNISKHSIVAGTIPQAESAAALDNSTTTTTDLDATNDRARAASQTQIHLIKNIFGAMSEQGAGLVIKEFGETRTTPEGMATATKRPPRILNTTRYDVPHMRFRYKIPNSRKKVVGKLPGGKRKRPSPQAQGES